MHWHIDVFEFAGVIVLFLALLSLILWGMVRAAWNSLKQIKKRWLG